jgi:2-C-methyl-D-erythritol 4-phosphate cytidylyltransferase/2-C-methyl-D-erythritol 2,4-cyclodiphosphate synthase
MPDPFAAILVAAGRSTRMGTDKLWIDLYGRPVWRWGLDALLAADGLLIVAIAVPEDGVERFSGALPEGARERCVVFPGGAERADSVIKGVWALTGAGHDDERMVLVHDAARPAVTTELIARVAEAASGGGSAIPIVPVADSLKRVRAERLAGSIERDEVVAAQTPQAATLGALRAAIEEVYTWGRPITDDAGALAAAGRSVRVVPGDPANIKLTGPDDLNALRGILASRATPVADGAHATDDAARTGIGFDAHRLEAGRALRLGGLDFPDERRGLVGHSDGDAALHAVIDALLGAGGLGDVGSLFPPGDDAWAGADSADLLLRTTELLWQAGVRPAWIDLAVVAASPQIAPRRDEMGARIAGLTGLPSGSVTVKGTTSDGLGFGGGEGIAAWAVAGVRPVG